MGQETRQDTERVRRRLTSIVINGRRVKVPGTSIAYRDVIRLAYGDAPVGDNTSFTVTYRGGKRPRTAGTLAPGASVELNEEMIFNVTPADKS